MTIQANLTAPEVLKNPHALYAELRRTAPVCQVEPGGLWAVTRYEDIVYVFKNPQLFSSEGIRFATEPPWLGRTNPVSASLLLMDPPAHTRLRALINRAFAPPALARLEPRIRALCDELTTRLLERRTVDFVQEFSLHLPAGIIGLLLGLDPSLNSHFKRWSDNLLSISATRPDDTVHLDEIRRDLADMEHYLREVLESRRRQPGDDMVSDLLAARVDGDALTDKELMGFLFLLLIAGLETTLNLLSSCALMLARQPGLLERLRANPQGIPRFIDEVLRYEPPVLGIMRQCTQEVVLGGVPLPKGALVLPLMGSGLRDEAHFPDADQFNPEREGTKQRLAFGHGIHFCVGAPLARMEARHAMEALLSRVGRLTLRCEEPEWLPFILIRGLKSLPLEVEPV